VSNVFQKMLFYTKPRAFYEDGHLVRLSGSAVKLYDLLCALAQRHSAVRIEVPAYAIFDFTGMHSSVVLSARRELADAKLISTKKGAHGTTIYFLLDPRSGEPLPAPEHHRGHYRYEASPWHTARTTRAAWRTGPKIEIPAKTPPWDEVGTLSDHRNSVSTLPKSSDDVTEKRKPHRAETADSQLDSPASRTSLKTISERGSLKDAEHSFDLGVATTSGLVTERLGRAGIIRGDQIEIANAAALQRSDAALVPQPQKCFVHRIDTTWWLRPGGATQSDLVCSRCHPDPRSGEVDRSTRHYSLAELLDIRSKRSTQR
jgi:hypothetical protein